MISLVAFENGNSAENRWSSKLNGDLRDGDPLLTQFTIQGSVEINELGGHTRLFLRNIEIIKRQLPLTDKLKDEFRQRYYDERIKEGVGVIYPKDIDDEEERTKALAEEDEVLQQIIEKERKIPVNIPALKVFITDKKPKNRMVDAHKAGILIHFSSGDTFAPKEKIISQFEGPIKDIPESLLMKMQGVVILKLPQDSPITAEPLIYAYAKLESARNIKIRTAEALQLTNIAEYLSKVVEVRDHAQKQSKADSRIKAFHIYKSLASNCWKAFGIEGDDTVDFEQAFQMLDFAEVFVIKAQARRLFDAIDTNRSGRVGIIDFENILIAYDALNLSRSGMDLVLLDVFDSFKTTPVDVLFQREQKLLKDAKTMAAEKKEVPKNSDSESDDSDSQKNMKKKSKGVFDAKNDNKTKLLGTKPNTKDMELEEGIDFSSFCEAIQMLGVKQKEGEPDAIREAFCAGGGVTVSEVDGKHLSVDEFRKAFLRIADIDAELLKRGLRKDGGLFGAARNRERLARITADVEAAYRENLGGVLTFIDRVKQERRARKDQRRREQEAFREKLLHEALRFQALRSQEKRLKIKKEQEERAKQRVDGKVLRNKLLQRQQENQLQKQREIQANSEQSEKLRLSEIRALGLDRLELGASSLRSLSAELYTTPSAQMKLSYVVLLDLSFNLLEQIPQQLCYWMTSCKHMKLSQNRLKLLPSDLGIQMASLEILEIDNNHLLELPESLGHLAKLRRLDFSSNHLQHLPDSWAGCGELRQLCAHSNDLKHVPRSLGRCSKLEYIDLARNHLEALGDDLLVELSSLTHLNLSLNRLLVLPASMGGCSQLRLLDVSRNRLQALPSSFQQLVALEHCNLEYNDILCMNANKIGNVAAAELLDGMTALKLLNVRGNRLQILPLGAMAGRLSGKDDVGSKNSISMLSSSVFSLTALDLSANSLASLPQELGLLDQLLQLSLQRNRLTVLPAELGSLSVLQRLDVSHNLLLELPGCLGQLQALRSLDISCNPNLSQLPRSIIGLVNLLDLHASRCSISAFPDTVTSLPKLTELDVSINAFRHFPIELVALSSSLRSLDLSGNKLTLLPRNINSLSFLTNLDLSRNNLRALPVEFVDILESVVSVQLASNPWDLLPAKWGSSRVQSAGSSYSVAEVADLLYAARRFYSVAEQLWLSLGALHYNQRLGWDHFLAELRGRLAGGWDETLVPLVKHVYFTSRSSGEFLCWHSVDKFTAEEGGERRRRDATKRMMAVEEAEQTQQMQAQRANAKYHTRPLAVASSCSDQGVNLQAQAAQSALANQLTDKTQQVKARVERRQRRLAKGAEVEARRLIDDVLLSDREGCLLDRQRTRDKARQVLFKHVLPTGLGISDDDLS